MQSARLRLISIVEQVLGHPIADFGDSGLRLGRLRKCRYEDVRHALIDVEFHRLASLIERLIEADEIAEEDFLRSALDQGWRETLCEVPIYGRNVGVFVIFCIRVRERRRSKNMLVGIVRLSIAKRDISIPGL